MLTPNLARLYLEFYYDNFLSTADKKKIKNFLYTSFFKRNVRKFFVQSKFSGNCILYTCLFTDAVYISYYSSEKSWELYSGGVCSIWIGISRSHLALSHLLPYTNTTNGLLSTVPDAALYSNCLPVLTYVKFLKYYIK